MSLARYRALAPTSSMVTLRRSGATSGNLLYIVLKPVTPLAASVRIGPAETALTRIPSGPRSAAR
jgi:hypothetical protein